MGEQPVRKILQKTVDLEDFLQLAQREPMKFFDECQIEEVRKHCLDYLKSACVTSALADWYEATISDLYKINDHLAGVALTSYLYRVGSPFRIGSPLNDKGYETYIIRAIEFLVNFSNVVPAFSNHASSKLLVGLMKTGHHSPLSMYDKMQFLPPYLSKLLKKINSKDYSETDWDCARRAMDIIVAVEDFSFIKQLLDLKMSYEMDDIYPSVHGRYDTVYTHKGTLQAAYEKLMEIMDQALVTHPDDERIIAFTFGKMSDSWREVTHNHLARCGRCTARQDVIRREMYRQQ